MPAYLHIQLFCFYNTLTALHSHIMHLYAHRILATPVNISLPENFYARSAHEVCLFLVIQNEPTMYTLNKRIKSTTFLFTLVVVGTFLWWVVPHLLRLP